MMQNKTEIRSSEILSKAKEARTAFDKKMRRLRWIGSGVIVFLAFCLAGLVFLLTQNAQKQTQTQAIAKPTIALVNEDQSAAFNGTDYDFGQNFVKLVSNDSKYNWQVVSRAVADRAYSDKSVSAVIYLPQNFTQNILSLQAIDPQKAEVDYKVLPSRSTLTNALLQDKIVNVLYDFNTSIVKMYYTSVAGNVASAQTNMDNVVSSQGTILTALKNNVYQPFQTTNQGYSSVVSVSNGLKTENSSWIQAQNGFTQSVKSMLQSNSGALNGELPNLTNYFGMQKQITDINLANANQGITAQASADHTFYFAQYLAAYNKNIAALQKLSASDSSGNETGLFADLKAKISDYNTIIGKVQADIGTQILNLADRQTTLLNLEHDLYSQFFAQDVTPTTSAFDFTSLQTEANARTALANLISRSFAQTDNITGSAYQTTINQLINNLSVDKSQYDTLLTTLVTNGSISSAQKAKYEAELDVLSHYANTYQLSPISIDFSQAPTSNTTDQTFQKTLKITVPAATAYTVTPTLSSGVKMTSVVATGTGATVNPDNSVTLDNSKDATGNATTTPMTYTITYSVDLVAVTSATVKFDWGAGATQEAFVLYPANSINDYLGGQFESLANILSHIDTASSLIAFLYGAPGATVADLSGVTDFASLSKNSIFQKYGNMDTTQIAKSLNADDVKQFMQEGQSNITNVTETLDTLTQSISNLQADEQTLANNMPSDYFSQMMTNLKNWYSQTMDEANAQFKAWTQNSTTQLQEKPWTAYSSSDTSLYYDKASGDDLYNTLTQMISSSAKQASDTAANAQTIKDNSATFETMVTTVSQTQSAAQKVIDQTGSLLSNGNGSLVNSQDYSKNFATVLSNTRTNGVNANNIFDFLAKPLATKNVSPSSSISVQGFDGRWILIFVIGILLGILGKTWIRGKVPKIEMEEKE